MPRSARGFVNDDASPIRIAAGYEAVLYEHDNFTGRSATILGDSNCIGVSHAGFDDVVTSIIVRRAAGTLSLSDDFNSISTDNWIFETGGWGSNGLVIEVRRDNPANYGCW